MENCITNLPGDEISRMKRLMDANEDPLRAIKRFMWLLHSVATVILNLWRVYFGREGNSVGKYFLNWNTNDFLCLAGEFYFRHSGVLMNYEFPFTASFLRAKKLIDDFFKYLRSFDTSSNFERAKGRSMQKLSPHILSPSRHHE